MELITQNGAKMTLLDLLLFHACENYIRAH